MARRAPERGEDDYLDGRSRWRVLSPRDLRSPRKSTQHWQHDIKYYKYDMDQDPDQVQHELELDCFLPQILNYCTQGWNVLKNEGKDKEGYQELKTAIKQMMVLICTQTFHACAKSRRDVETMNKITDPFQHYELNFLLKRSHDSYISARYSARYVQNLYCDIILTSPVLTQAERRFRHATFGRANEYEHEYVLSVKYQDYDHLATHLATRFMYEGIDKLDSELCDEHKIRQLTKQQHDSEMQFGRQEHTETNPEDIGGGAAGGGAAGACIVPQLQNPYCLDKN
jgi:hypothetical protein